MFAVQNEIRKPKVLIHGAAGSGKSTLASKANNVAFIDLENGIPHIKVPSIRMTQYTELKSMLEKAMETPFDTIVIDSLSYLETMIHNVIAKQNGKKNITDIPFHKGYDYALEHWALLLELINQMTAKKTVICTCHSIITHVNDPVYGEYDEFVPSIHKKAYNLLTADFDAILAIKPHIIISDEKAMRTNKTYVYTQPSQGIAAKSRFNLADKILVNEFDWNKLQF